jgi:N-acetylneuraminic acid mutarotase
MKTVTILSLMLSISFFANAQAGIWKVLETKNDVANRGECGMASVNGKLYLIGGGDAQLAVQSFDPAKMMWTTLAKAPILMHHFQAVALGDNIYVLEAFSTNNFPNQTSMPNVYFYDIKKDQWQKGGDMPAERRRAGAGAVSYSGKLYLVAGILHGHASGTTNLFDCYDPATGKWTSLPDAPHVRDHCSAAVIKNKLYVVGGRNTSFRDPENKIFFYSQTMLDVDCYDFETGKWSTLPAKLPLGSGGGAVVNLNDVLYYMGGERAIGAGPNGPRKNTFYLDPATQDQWTETDSLHYPRNGMAAAVINNKIYAAGGSGGGPGGPGYHLANGKNPAPAASMGQPNPPLPGPAPGIKSGAKQDKLIVEVFTLTK